MLVFVTNISHIEFQVRHLAKFHHFSYRPLQVVLNGTLCKNIQLMLESLKIPFLVLHFLLYINNLPDDVICSITIYADDTTPYS